jgi:hypothetical protein
VADSSVLPLKEILTGSQLTGSIEQKSARFFNRIVLTGSATGSNQQNQFYWDQINWIKPTGSIINRIKSEGSKQQDQINRTGTYQINRIKPTGSNQQDQINRIKPSGSNQLDRINCVNQPDHISWITGTGTNQPNHTQ